MIHYALIVAGGSGSRMGSAIPKQFLDLGGKPVLVHTLEKFFTYLPAIQVILVLPETDFDQWTGIKNSYRAAHHSVIQSLSHSVIAVPGGATRFQSVRNGLSVLSGEGLVAIHDAVRPLVSVEVIQRSFETAARFGSGVVTVPAKDSIRHVSENGSSVALDRATLRLVQTPQTFRLSLIKKAFEQTESPLFTDDASVAEAAGFQIHLVEGSYENLKITTPDDLVVAEALMRLH